MAKEFHVSLEKLNKEFSFEIVYCPMQLKDIWITNSEINRPGLFFAGFSEFFDPKRIQIIGKTEYGFLMQMSPEARRDILEKFFAERPICVICTRNLPILPEVHELSQKYKVSVCRTGEPTSAFQAALISTLNVELAPRITRHGVLVEVYGEGILLLGESGVGKSETAIELIKRGHRLIADDAVELRRVSDRTLIGTSPDNIRHFMEMRGVGIINARRLFGMGAVKMSEKIELIIKLESWEEGENYDRLGLEDQVTDVLGLKIPTLTIPVKTGRNLAVIIEVAAMNHRQKKMGYNAAQELLDRLGKEQQGKYFKSKEWDEY